MMQAGLSHREETFETTTGLNVNSHSAFLLLQGVIMLIVVLLTIDSNAMNSSANIVLLFVLLQF